MAVGSPIGLTIDIKQQGVKDMLDEKIMPDDAGWKWIMEEVALEVQDAVEQRVNDGRAVDGGNFKKYDEDYEDWKRRYQKIPKGVGLNLPDRKRGPGKDKTSGWWLVLDGSMMNSFQLLESSAKHAIIGFSGMHTNFRRPSIVKPKSNKRRGGRKASKGKPGKGKKSNRDTGAQLSRKSATSKPSGRKPRAKPIDATPRASMTNAELAFINNLSRPFVGFSKQEIEKAFELAFASAEKLDIW